MNRLLLIFSLCLLIACSAEKSSDTGREKASGKNEKIVHETAGIPATDTSPSLATDSLAETQDTTDNHPPELSRVKLMPEVFKPDDRLYIEAEGSDIDGNEVTIIYEWTLNGEPAGNSREIDAQIKRGDRISVKITPYDGELYGSPVTLKREIDNMPPVITEDNLLIFDGKTCTYQIKASDPDGDDLIYSLKTAPEGMTVDSSGLMTWDVPPDFKGKEPVAVSVLDGNGGEAVLNFNVNINAEKK